MDNPSETLIKVDPVSEITCAQCQAEVDISEVEAFAEFPCPQCQATLTAPAQFGNFRLLKVLGSGGMGSVFLAEDLTLGRRVALKVMLKSLGDNPEFVENFKREAQAAAKLNHTHIAQIYAFGQHEGQPYIVMELVSGKRFDDLVDAGERLDPPFVIKVGADIAEGLRVAADIGLVHGDIKPDNILLNEQFHAKLVDFGIASMSNEKSDEIWGTPYYIAPEKVRRQRIDLRTDIYSLGATLYHAIAGQPPFDGETPIDVVKARFHEAPRPLDEVRDDVDPQIARIIGRMLQLDPGMRYPTYQSLLSDMYRFLDSVGGADRIAHAVVGSSKRMIIRKKGQTGGAPPRTKGMVVQRGSFADASRTGRGTTTGSLDAAYAAKPLPSSMPPGKRVGKRRSGSRWVLWVILGLLVAVGGGVGTAYFFAQRDLPEDVDAERVQPETPAERLSGLERIAAAEQALKPFADRARQAETDLRDLASGASNRFATVWGPDVWDDILKTVEARRQAHRAAEPEPEPEVAAEEDPPENDAAPVAETDTAPAPVDPETIFEGRARVVHEAAPAVWSAVLAFKDAYGLARERLSEARGKRDRLLDADPSTLALDELDLGPLAPPDTAMGAVYQTLEQAEAVLAEAKTAYDTLNRHVAAFESRQAAESAAREREAAEARERAAREAAEAERRERETAERRRVLNLEADQTDLIQQRRYREARWTLRDLRREMQTDAGRQAVDAALKRIDRIESLHAFLAEQVKAQGVQGGWVEDRRTWDISADHLRGITVRGREIPWTDVGVAPTVRLIQHFLMDEAVSGQFGLRERVDQLVNAAIYSLMYGRGNPHAEQLARRLAQQAIQLFQGTEDLLRELVPELLE